jgi:hypothetical protein
MKSPRSIMLLLAVATIALSGCGSPKSRLTGKWKGKMEEQDLSAEITFELNADDTMVFNLVAGNATIPISGTWKVVESQGKDATIEIALENPLSKTVKTSKIDVTFVDGDTIEMSPPKGTPFSMSKEKLTLKRVD